MKKNELINLLEEYGEFRDDFENKFWKVILESENLENTFYKIYYNLEKKEFVTQECIGNEYDLLNDELIYITKIDRYFWDSLYEEYNGLKEYIEKDGDKIACNFHEWVEEETKETYIENTITLLIEDLKRN